jgi:hypothetical protein
MVAKPVSCQAGRRCGVGVVGWSRMNSAGFVMGLGGVSGRLLGRVAVEGESPVRENTVWLMGAAPE